MYMHMCICNLYAFTYMYLSVGMRVGMRVGMQYMTTGYSTMRTLSAPPPFLV